MSTSLSAYQCCNVPTELALCLFTTLNSPINFTAIRERQVDFLQNFLITRFCNLLQVTATTDNFVQTLHVTSLQTTELIEDWE
jgi:hypothetical protein